MARAGLYREQIRVVTPGTPISDGEGGFIPQGASTEVPVWSRIQPAKGSELLALGKEFTTQPLKITVRYRSDLQGAQRIIWGTKNLRIISQVPDEKKTELFIYVVGTE